MESAGKPSGNPEKQSETFSNLFLDVFLLTQDKGGTLSYSVLCPDFCFCSLVGSGPLIFQKG
ncbi:hypothetical protein GCD22_02527 [Acidithiobacillus thiooxidans ATCC 19377]|uniref:Uncharacterized protein n=1 Tax=Acidithiobacillus thiooxidans ATCC 19377 TaxID=637390 RepID=A0A5P9XTM8_ACITH|nr:hypothetical protein GCD22_02527 [Acidithiobacillus thiooxidans ATCC 19377]